MNLRLRARYSLIVTVKSTVGPILAIMDTSGGDHMSVTNDAEAVVADLYGNGSLNEGIRLIYQDSDGIWDELVHEKGAFVAFRALRCRDMMEAVLMIETGKDSGVTYA
jgi:hypothetical protein